MCASSAMIKSGASRRKAAQWSAAGWQLDAERCDEPVRRDRGASGGERRPPASTGLGQFDESKPPSSDGLKKKPRIPGSLRGRSDKKSGGQAGHKGDTLRQVAQPDRVVRHEAPACRLCLAGLTVSMQRGVERRQVFDLPDRLIEVTEHQASIYCCAACGGETKAEFPAGVAAPAQYGERVRAAAVYLNVHQLIPEDRIAEAEHDPSGTRRFVPLKVYWARNVLLPLAVTRTPRAVCSSSKTIISRRPSGHSRSSILRCVSLHPWGCQGDPVDPRLDLGKSNFAACRCVVSEWREAAVVGDA